jgi:hypothetical protein
MVTKENVLLYYDLRACYNLLSDVMGFLDGSRHRKVLARWATIMAHAIDLVAIGIHVALIHKLN